MACLLIQIIGRKEKNVFKTFVITKIIDFNHTCKKALLKYFFLFIDKNKRRLQNNLKIYLK
jgi:hypothetical protein